jgi:hypothetical protein
MSITKEQRQIIKEGILDRVIDWYVNRQYWKAKKMFEDDPELQAITKKMFDHLESASKKFDDYCKKYGCVEPSKHTIKLEKLKDMPRDKKKR